MRWLILGAGGQLGRCLEDALALREQDFVVFDSSALDITSVISIDDVFRANCPDVVVNAAAYTAVDKAEEQCDQAFAVNAKAPGNLASACKCVGAKFIHVSTDYVFSGDEKKAYVETDKIAPKNVYGQSKADGEMAVLDSLPEAVIIRTSWVFSEYGNNFLKTMLRLAKERDSISVVDDQFGCPTYAGDLAAAICDIGLVHSEREDIGGIYHFSGDVAVSWFEFCRQILNSAHSQGVISKCPDLIGIPTSAYPTAAYRPPFSVLDCKKISSLGVAPSNWKLAVDEVVKRLRFQFVSS